jgi:hypothetical protein
VTVSADSTFRTADPPVTTRKKHKKNWFESLWNSMF